jgi:hypothetical protein
MFGKRTAVEMQRTNPVLEQAVQGSAEAYAKIPLHNFIDEERRSELARELYLEVSKICNTTDPVAVCRDEFAATMLKSAAYQVLVIAPPPEPDDSGLRKQPGISGELKAHLVALCEKNDDLRSIMYAETDSRGFDVLWPIVQRLHWETRWLLETLNATRIALGDSVDDDDWYEPFLHAACVNLEHKFRWELEMPSAFAEDIAREAASTYPVFTDIVLSGAKNPADEWREFARGTGVPMPDFAS